MTKPYTSYIALGDSISIDDYPRLEASAKFGVPCDSPIVQGLGAASLLAANRDDVWFEFEGHDLRYHDRGTADWLNLAVDGATTWSVLEGQIPYVRRSEERTLVTLTAGGNDLLRILHAGAEVLGREQVVRAVPRNLREIIRRVKARRPNSTVVLGTIYDPTDGTNLLPPHMGSEPLPLEGSWLRETNDAIRGIANGNDVRLADIHRHFLGHGWQSEECWYWSGLIFEPSAKGASEVRRLWLEAGGVERGAIVERRLWQA